MLHENITERIIGAAMKVHSALGAGCLESTYSACLCHQLSVDGLHFEHQHDLPDLDLVSRLHLDVGDDAADVRRHFDRRLVGLELEHRLVLLDGVPRLHQNANDITRCDEHADHIALLDVFA